MRIPQAAVPPVLALVAAIAILGAASRSEPPSPARPAAAPPAPAVDAHLFAGPTSCAAAACHNAGGPSGARGSEYSTWLLGDPHATQAFVVLASQRSRRMVQLHSGEKHSDATRYPLCLKCHAPNATTGHVDQVAHAEGVSCEACHGAAEKWRGDHFSRDWQALSPAGKQQRGFKLTRLPSGHIDLITRVRACASCHVGDANREVDHDLIAAGHPPLFFEYAAYDAIYPGKHWRDPPTADHAVRAWAVGQVAQALAAVELTEARARRKASDPRAQVWPEFSESSCFACHHDLGSDRRREFAALAKSPAGPPGRLPWATWHTATLDVLAEHGGKLAAPAGVKQGLNALRLEMEKRAPDPVAVAGLATRVQGDLNGWLTSLPRSAPLTLDDIAGLTAALRRHAVEAPDAVAQWDSATQHYLGLAACYSAIGGPTPEVREQLERLRAALRYPDKSDSPRGYDPAAVRNTFSAIKP